MTIAFTAALVSSAFISPRHSGLVRRISESGNAFGVDSLQLDEKAFGILDPSRAWGYVDIYDYFPYLIPSNKSDHQNDYWGGTIIAQSVVRTVGTFVDQEAF